jgi:hypothetical protein
MRIHRLPCPASAMQAEGRSHDGERGSRRIEAIERLNRGLYSH